MDGRTRAFTKDLIEQTKRVHFTIDLEFKSISCGQYPEIHIRLNKVSFQKNVWAKFSRPKMCIEMDWYQIEIPLSVI